MASTSSSSRVVVSSDSKAERAVPLSELNGIPESSPYKGSVTAALSGKTIFLTGATGFLGKIVIEKILRSVPTVGAIFVLVRPRKGQPASERLEKEVISSEVFTRLRRERPDADAFIRSKLVPIAGELTQKGVGFSDSDLRMIIEHVNIFIHCAAVVDFNERLDRALELNTLGSLRLLDVAKQCRACGAFLHVSTAYVNSNKQGWIDEKVYPLPFDAETMIKKIRGMRDSDLEKITVTGLLGDWPNTYTFTKAMTERLLVEKRGNMPLVICRPSIIGSCWKEPVPGWVDVISAAGAVYMSVAFGVLKFLPGDEKSIADIVPADYVVNAMLASLPAIYNQDRYFVMHACTSTEKPLPWGIPREIIISYFRENPPDKQLSSPGFAMIPSPQEYQLQFFLRYSIPSALLNTVSTIGNKATKDKAQQFNKLVWRVRVIIEAFRHFTEHEWFFDNKHTRACFHALSTEERALFPLSLEDMDWVGYNRNFAYGLSKFVLKGDMVEVDEVEPSAIQLTKESYKAPAKGMVGFGQRLFSDGHWTVSHFEQREKMYPQPRPVADMRQIVLSSPAVQAAIKAEAARAAKTAAKPSKSAKGPAPSALEQAESRARAIIDRMFADQHTPVMGGMAYGFRKVWRRLYKNITVDQSGVERVREMARKNGPIIFIPTHRSYIDFLIISFMCFAVNLPLPYIAAGEDFLGILLVRWLFRKSGAFFLRRSFLGSSDQLYSVIFREYVQRILTDGQSLEFFIEGTRSRSGKMLHPKMGLLSIITDVFLDKKINTDITILPVSINYEKTMEGDLYSSELQGDNKIRESLRSLLASSSVLNINFGRITLKMADPISLREYTSSHMESMKTATQLPPRLTYTSNPGALPTFVAATAVKPPVDDDEGAVERKDVAVAGEFKYDPYGRVEHRKHYNRMLAYKVVYDLSRTSECMATHLVATLMLMYRQGITKAQLVRKVDWLRQEVNTRGMKVVGADGNYRTAVVDDAMVHLRSTIIQRRQNVYEPAILARHEYKNMLVLGHYRNKIAHLFWLEGLVACALYALIGQGHDSATSSAASSSSSSSATVTSFSGGRATASSASGEWKNGAGVDKEVLLREVRFLHSLLHREFIYKEHPDTPDNFEGIIDIMVKRGILKVSSANRIEVATTGEAHFSFLCALLWPFIDSYFVALMILFSLQPDRVVEEGLLLQRTQWLATTLYHESMLCFYESCSLETLRNAFVVLQEWRVIKLAKGSGDKRSQTFVSIIAPFVDEEPLEELVARVSRLRKQPAVRKSATRKNLIADIPILAKL